MARRGSSSLGSARGPPGGAGGIGMTSALQAASAQMDRLRAELLSSLTSVVSDTVDMAFEQHEESFVQAAQAVHQLSGGGVAGGGNAPARGKPARGGGFEAKVNGDADGAMPTDYDFFHQCCQRLVGYIDANMATSPDFKQQMDRVILACHSNASEAVLKTVVTRKLWLHTRSHANGTDDDDEQEMEEEEVEEEDGEEEVIAVRTKKPSRDRASRAPPPKPASRGPKKRTPPPPPSPPPRRAKAKSPVKKRARRESSSRKVNYAPRDEDPEDEEEEEEEEEEVQRKRKRRATRIRYSEDEDEAEQQDEDDDDVVFVAKTDAKSQPHYGQADELLTFKDAIGDMCYADRRTPAQTRFFKERLRKAIQFVDAQLCKPPKGKSCIWECAKIRRQMCNRDLPCRNKICRLWHDVEAHTDRCQNSHCEFRIRVMLRETMYKIDHKKLELQGFRNELASKKKDLQDLKNESLPDRENFVERRLLDNEIDQLESEIENAEKDLGIFKATKKTYWATLNEIGITVEDDVNDQFPPFKAHYADKKAPKKKALTKARHSEEHTTSFTPAGPSRSARARRRQSADAADSTASPVKQRERITRRSTQQSLKVLSNGVIELDDDDDEEVNEEEEAKTDRSAEYDDDATKSKHMEDTEASESAGAGVSVENEEPEEEDGAANNLDETEVGQSEGVDEDDRMSPETDLDKPTALQSTTTTDTRSMGDGEQHDEHDSEGNQVGSSSPLATSASAMSSALDAFNQVVDAHSEPPAPTSGSALPTEAEEEDQGETTAAMEEDNAPLLPF